MALFDDDDGPAEDRPMTLGEHLDELRKRVIWCLAIAGIFMVFCACIEEALLGLLMWPAYSVLREMKGAELISTEVGEKFITSMKMDVVAGLFLGAPLILYVLWGFVARGLHEHERRYVRIYAPVSYLLFMGGCVFFYFVVQPLTLRFLLWYHATDIYAPDGSIIPVSMKLGVQPLISFFLSMTLVTGLIFEMPLVMLFLQALGLCTWRTYVKMWKHFIFGLMVFCAVITPTGDAFTLTVYMAPVLALFFGGVLVCRMMAPKDT